MLTESSLSAFIATAKPDEARGFYENVLGLTFLSEDEYAMVFDANGTTLRIQKSDPFTPHPFTSLGWHVDDIEATVAELGGRGVVFERYPWMEQNASGVMTFPGGARVAWFKDPDGNVLSLDQY